jgi:anti-anti-sigma regulatory factor
MLSVGIENIGDMAVFSCKGDIVSSEDASSLRIAVTSRGTAQILVLDLTQVYDIAADGLDALSDLQQWAWDQNIQLKLFGPSVSVRNRLEHNESVRFEIAHFREMIGLLAHADSFRPKAA